MKAIVCEEHGPPESLKLRDLILRLAQRTVRHPPYPLDLAGCGQRHIKIALVPVEAAAIGTAQRTTP